MSATKCGQCNVVSEQKIFVRIFSVLKNCRHNRPTVDKNTYKTVSRSSRLIKEHNSCP